MITQENYKERELDVRCVKFVDEVRYTRSLFKLLDKIQNKFFR